MVTDGREVPLGAGLVALVDAADYPAVLAAGCWHVRRNGRNLYAQRSVARSDGVGTTEQLHRFITGWPYVDHINGDGLDNRRANLRRATHRQNMGNQRARKDCSSALKGVTARDGRWFAQIRSDGSTVLLGYFDREEDAARAYDVAAREVFGEFARVNFPDEDGPPPTRRRASQSSSFLGVSIYRRVRRWRAYIRVDGKQRHIGHFATEIEAARAYDRVARETFGPATPVNFPEEI